MHTLFPVVRSISSKRSAQQYIKHYQEVQLFLLSWSWSGAKPEDALREQQHTQLEFQANSSFPSQLTASLDKSLPRSLPPSPVCNTRALQMDPSDTAARKFIHASLWVRFNHHATGTAVTQCMSTSFYANPRIPVELLPQPGPHLLVYNPMEKPMNLYFICTRSFPGSLQ